MFFKAVCCDIVNMETDAIVNAANSALLPGGGVCGAIFSAAGYSELQAACEKIGFCGVGNAVITNGFNLKAKYIVHTVGPIYQPGNMYQEMQLYNCYKNSLNIAQSNGIKSIAFPLISSGIYGYPKEEAIMIAVRAITEFLHNNDMEVYLVIYEKEDFNLCMRLLGEEYTKIWSEE